MQRFFARLPILACWQCGHRGALIRHGYTRWYKSPTEHGLRGWRIRCKQSPRRQGCNTTRLLRLAHTIPHRSFDANQLWRFLASLLTCRSIKAAWEAALIPFSLDTGYRLHRRLILIQSTLRTHLCARAPPPPPQGKILFQAIHHLKEVFGDATPATTFQLEFQRSILATVA